MVIFQLGGRDNEWQTSKWARSAGDASPVGKWGIEGTKQNNRESF